MNQTELLSLLDELQIAFHYTAHPAVYCIEDCHRLAIPFVDQGLKNLFLKNRKGTRYYLLVMDENKTADLTALAELLSEPRLSFASPERLRACLGVEPGTVTPFGVVHDKAQQVQVLIDSSVKTDQLLGFHPLVNTATMALSYGDFLRFLEYCDHTPQWVALR